MIFHTLAEIDAYRKWCDEQKCIDCGNYQKDGEVWVTEIQCWDCWLKYGATELRGLPSAEEMFLKAAPPIGGKEDGA